MYRNSAFVSHNCTAFGLVVKFEISVCVFRNWTFDKRPPAVRKKGEWEKNRGVGGSLLKAMLYRKKQEG